MGGCHSGDCHHTALPHCNSNTDLGNICQSLVSLRWLVQDANNMDSPPNDKEEASKKRCHDALASAISAFERKAVFHNVGSMMGQHMLWLLIKSSVIWFPALANCTCFHPNTKSHA